MKKIRSIEEAEQALNELRELDVRIGIATATANKKIAEIDKEYLAETKDSVKRTDQLRSALQMFALANRIKVFNGKKSIKLGIGDEIGFKDSPATVEPFRRLSWKTVIQKAMAMGFMNLVRPGEPQFNKVIARDYSDEQLRVIGLKRVESESFFIELKTVGEVK